MELKDEKPKVCYEINHCRAAVNTKKMDCEKCELKHKEKEKEVYKSLLGC